MNDNEDFQTPLAWLLGLDPSAEKVREFIDDCLKALSDYLPDACAGIDYALACIEREIRPDDTAAVQYTRHLDFIIDQLLRVRANVKKYPDGCLPIEPPHTDGKL